MIHNKIQIIIMIIAIVLFGGQNSLQAKFEIPSTLSPVGSGARAIGQGSAFIAVADDATAASWNPAGLYQLDQPELSMVSFGVNRMEDIDLGLSPGKNRINLANINFLSFVYPFRIFNENMVVSLSYQYLYDFNREWRYTLRKVSPVNNETFMEKHIFKQKGYLSATSLSFCSQFGKQLSLGFTLNIWDDSLSNNSWEQTSDIMHIDTAFGQTEKYKSLINYKYAIQGYNFNAGILWKKLDNKIRLGAVIKTPFKANLEQIEKRIKPDFYQVNNGYLKMPLSYGFGLVYNYIQDELSFSFDIYRTNWNHCVYKYPNQQEAHLLTGKDINQIKINATTQVRMGVEYLMIDPISQNIYTIRSGLYSDPSPSKDHTDSFYGFTFGLGYAIKNYACIDLAYQFRFGRNVGELMVDIPSFSENVQEHSVYLSTILYAFE